MDGRDLSLQNGVNKAVARKHVLALELRGDNYCLESLTTAACTKVNMISVRAQWVSTSLPNSYPIDPQFRHVVPAADRAA